MDDLNGGPNYIVAAAPFRISFAGGGTDLPAFYQREGGAVFSCAIDQHVYVTVKRLSRFFDGKYRLNYSQTEIVDRVEDIENGIIRACLTLVPVPPPLYVGVIADVPTSSGLGASSSFAVSLLAALHAMRGERVSAAQLAEEAVKSEIDILHQPIGKQDQYVAACGGLNYLSFESNGRVNVEAQSLPGPVLREVFDSLLMFWTGISRDAGTVLEIQNQNTDRNLEILRRMKTQAQQLREMTMRRFDIAAFGEVLTEGWELKRQLCDAISTDEIDGWHRAGLRAGAYGGKLCGAGGGGFLLFVAPPDRHDNVRRELGRLRELRVQYEPHGARVILPSWTR
jgi:D-glycero-alpha-D-manno-heptose-7-phosphate kinase